jgi:HEPN domain-containing protein/predicted nucleotidyltransferase
MLPLRLGELLDFQQYAGFPALCQSSVVRQSWVETFGHREPFDDHGRAQAGGTTMALFPLLSQRNGHPRRVFTRHILGVIQRAHASTDIPREIAARIAQELQPWRIVLFGSRARGNPKQHSDYDVFVEIDAERAALKALDQRIRDLFRGGGWTLDLKLAQRGDLERRRDDPGTIEWDVAREGRLLYADPSASVDIKPPDRVREPSPDVPESVSEWLNIARRDLRHCLDLKASGKDWSPEICWLSHQTCEKHLKALLVSRRVRPERTHDLTDLLAALRRAGCELPALDADCALLTKHAITPRYPKGLDLGEEDADAAFAAADRIVTAVREQLPPSVH